MTTTQTPGTPTSPASAPGSTTGSAPDAAPVLPEPARLDLDDHVPGFSRAMSRLDAAAAAELDAAGVDPLLRDLVRTRASQINGCAYCVDMHTRDARAAGESEQRLYALPVWREAPFFTARERAALALTEAASVLTDGHVPREVVDAAAAVFSERELAALVALVVTINAWNTIGVTTRAWVPATRTSPFPGAGAGGAPVS